MQRTVENLRDSSVQYSSKIDRSVVSYFSKTVSRTTTFWKLGLGLLDVRFLWLESGFGDAFLEKWGATDSSVSAYTNKSTWRLS